MFVEDPRAYRPATPILNWEGPERSHEAPKVPLWAATTVVPLFFLIVTAVVPPYIPSNNGRNIFVALWIALAAIVLALMAYLSTSRHLMELTELMSSITCPQDMDKVVERLENGRFSRFEEPWRVQVQIIKMFCRLLRFHHNTYDIDAHAPYDERTFDTIPPVRSEAYLVHTHGDDLPHAFNGADHSPTANDHELGLSGCAVTRPVPVDAMETESMLSANSEIRMEIEAFAPQSPGLQRKASFAPHTPTTPAGPKVTPADPLNDNDMSWEDALRVGSGEAPPSGVAMSLLKQVKIGQDLSKLVMPAHLLEPRSMLEKLSDFFVHPALLGQIASASTPADRMIAAVRWCLSSYHVQSAGARKPYNPVLGETFEAVFAEGSDDAVHYFAEQVSHHPPISCYRAVHRRTGVEVVGSYVPKSRLASINTAATMGEGFFDIYHPQTGETYRGSYPTLNISGLLSGPLAFEIAGTIHLEAAKAGIVAEVEFVKGGFFSGPSAAIKGLIKLRNGRPLFSISGKYTGVMTLTGTDELPASGRRTYPPKVDSVLFDPQSVVKQRPKAPPTAFPKPSRVVWRHITEALRNGDGDKAQSSKEAVEDKEREVRRQREARGEEFVPGYFRIIGEVKGVGKDTWRCIRSPVKFARYEAPLGSKPQPLDIIFAECRMKESPVDTDPPPFPS